MFFHIFHECPITLLSFGDRSFAIRMVLFSVIFSTIYSICWFHSIFLFVVHWSISCIPVLIKISSFLSALCYFSQNVLFRLCFCFPIIIDLIVALSILVFVYLVKYLFAYVSLHISLLRSLSLVVFHSFLVR